MTVIDNTDVDNAFRNLTAHRALLTRGSGQITSSSITNTELGYLTGTTSAIQTQINNKQPTMTGAATTVTTTDLTANRVLMSYLNGK